MTLFTQSHLEKLSDRDWMHLESFGFPVHLYPEKGNGGQGQHSSPEVAAATLVHTEETEKTPLLEANGGEEPGRAMDVSQTQCSAQKLEKPNKESEDVISQLVDQVPTSGGWAGVENQARKRTQTQTFESGYFPVG